MATPLTFGVEFEMQVLSGGPEDSHDGRIMQFEAEPKDLWIAVAHHMVSTLKKAGYNAKFEEEGGYNARLDEVVTAPPEFKAWDIGTDLSIDTTDEDCDHAPDYARSAIEVRSPALYYTPAALKEVEDVLALLRRTYLIKTNKSTGLHVHVGNGLIGWPYDIVRKVVAFSWGFEPQINSLIPPHRIDTDYVSSIRRYATFSEDFIEENGRRPTALEAVRAILSCETHTQLRRYFRCDNIKYLENMQFIESGGQSADKPTIEFRYHDGTVDGTRACMWIKTMVGIMQYLHTASPTAVTALFSVLEHERWEKVGDGYDDKREAKMGPILAEGGFTCIDLLQAMDLYESARYYKERGLYKHARQKELHDTPADRSHWAMSES